VVCRQAVEPGILEASLRSEAAALGVDLGIEWVSDLDKLRAALRPTGPDRWSLLVPTPGADDLDWLPVAARPVTARVDLGVRRPDRSPQLLVHVQGRGVDGGRWALRALVNRQQWPVVTVAYGDDPDQYVHLRTPATVGANTPVAVLLHGGFWRSKWELDLMDALGVDLARRGFASWNVEYRRPGRHGWAATVADVAASLTPLPDLAREHGLDLDRLVVFGHSAGGQLAARLAADSSDEGASGRSVRAALVVYLAGVLDLVETQRRDLGDGAVQAALGTDPERGAAEYAASSPLSLLPLRTAQLVVTGRDDSADLNEMSRRYAAAARAAGDAVAVLEGHGDHFTLIDPASAVWHDTLAGVADVIGDPAGDKPTTVREGTPA
jgi:acetyl esterase/lipase